MQEHHHGEFFSNWSTFEQYSKVFLHQTLLVSAALFPWIPLGAAPTGNCSGVAPWLRSFLRESKMLLLETWWLVPLCPASFLSWPPLIVLLCVLLFLPTAGAAVNPELWMQLQSALLREGQRWCAPVKTPGWLSVGKCSSATGEELGNLQWRGRSQPDRTHVVVIYE